MASRGSSYLAFQHVNHSHRVSKDSFSIRSILDLPDENAKKCVASSRKDSPVVDSNSVPRLLVPRVVRPMVHHYAERVPCSALRNWQGMELARYGHYWRYGSLPFREQAFPTGERINSIQISDFFLMSM